MKREGSEESKKARFLTRDHWAGLLARSSVAGEGSAWLEETGRGLGNALRERWAEVEVGGFLGGPSYGSGLLDDGRFALNSRAPIEEFLAEAPDASELFLTDERHPAWMVYKRDYLAERVLVISGCDAAQMNYFGKLTRRNHEYYAASQGYETRWHLWDRETWGTRREELVWAKIATVADALAEGCWDQVWWVDADAAFINSDRKLDRFLHPEWKGIFAEFHRAGRAMFSTGIFGCRPEAGELLRSVRERGGSCEEEAMTREAEENPKRWEKMLLVNHGLFNGVYGWNIPFMDPARTFTCHLVGQSNQTRRKVLAGINRALGI